LSGQGEVGLAGAEDAVGALSVGEADRKSVCLRQGCADQDQAGQVRTTGRAPCRAEAAAGRRGSGW